MGTAVRLVAAGAALLALSGCGQKGPLYLPDGGGDVVTRPAGQTQQPEQSTAPQPQPRQPNEDEAEKQSEPPR